MREQLKRFIYPLISGVVLAGAFAAVTVYANWTAPTAAPPTCATGSPGCDVPLHTGAGGQIKRGGLTVGEGLPDTATGFSVRRGRVGIGTLTPAEKLDVVGNARVSGNISGIRGVPYTWPAVQGKAGQALTNNGSGVLSWTTVGGSGSGLPAGVVGNTLWHNGTAWVAGSNIFNNNAYIGIGTVNPITKLDVFGDINTSGVYRVDGTVGVTELVTCPAGSTRNNITINGGIVTATGSCTAVGGGGGLTGGGTINFLSKFTGASVLGNSQVFDNGTNVGIGTASPTAKLDVRGPITTGAAAGVDTNIRVGGSGTGNHNAYIDFRGDDTYSAYGLRILRGNTGPNAVSQLVHRGLGDLMFQTTELARMRFRTGNTDRMTITAGGSVGIGTLTPGTSHSAPATVALDVAGKRITGVQDPVDDDDAVSLGYLKAQSGGGGGQQIVKASGHGESNCVSSPTSICKGNYQVVTVTATCPAGSFIIKCGFSATDTYNVEGFVQGQAAAAFNSGTGNTCGYSRLGAPSISVADVSAAVVALCARP